MSLWPRMQSWRRDFCWRVGKTAYVPEARVYHSHSFTIAQEFRRYFDTGVYHHRESWLRDQFGTPSGEGKRFVISELKYLFPRYMNLIPLALLRTISKASGYQLGLRELLWGKRMVQEALIP